MHTPEEEKYLNSKDELLIELQTLLGGRAAEQLVFGVQTTGAANDIQRATETARAMVTQYGMSDHFGLMALAQVSNEYLDAQSYTSCSDSTAARADEEIRNLLADCYEKATAVLRDNRALLDDIALYLLQKETITGDELMAFIHADQKKDESPADNADVQEDAEAPVSADVQAAEAAADAGAAEETEPNDADRG